MSGRVDPEEPDQNVSSVIGGQWVLVTAGTAEWCNIMMAGWGGLGVLWGKSVATIYIRPQQYTLEFAERENCFILSFFGGEYWKALALRGSESGQDVDKVKECGFTVAGAACGTPYSKGAELVLVCRKAYWQDMDPTRFLDGELGRKWYPERDYHRIFIGETIEVLKKN